MKTILSLVVSGLLFVSPSLLARPMAKVDVLSETQQIDKTVSGIEKYRQKFWAIGLNGDTLKPDGFLKFFLDRGLDFKFFVRSGTGVATGSETAYAENIKVLQDYKNKILSDEIAEVESILKALASYEAQGWAVGLNGDTLVPDQFLRYFADHSLPIEMFIQKDFVSIGDMSAYETNKATLEDYRARLDKVRDAMESSVKPVQPSHPAQLPYPISN